MSGPNPLDMFGLYALPPEGVQFVRTPPGGPTAAVVLDRCDEVGRHATEYCVHGQVTCAGCGAWCWLGDRTKDLVTSGDTAPVCRACAQPLAAAGGVRLQDNAGDHRRVDGPH